MNLCTTPGLETRKERLRNAVITNGFINPEPLAELIKVVEAIKIDLKAFNQDFYTNYVRGQLKPSPGFDQANCQL